ncbi:alpha/beta fold hydrolase [Elongatibacter sediminis]|uniref:Alpha/beta hydrolase n=1 Tax=Elongatibacter sediminis TaxID=3119006 RepID=A0AAW9RCE5_9GAMM
MSFRERYFRSSDGLSLYYRDYGSGGNVVLCLHGLTRNSRDFHDLAEHLSARYRVLAADIRGRGKSDRDRRPARYTPAVYVRDAWRLLDQAGVDRFTLIGTSLGGLMGMIMANQQAGRLRGLVLNDIGPEVPPAATARILEYAGRTPPAADWAEAARQSRQAYELALPDLPDSFWDDYARQGWRENSAGRPEPDVDPAVGDVLRNPPLAARAIQCLYRRGLVRRVGGVPLNLWEAFRAVTMPCLVIHGKLSDVLTPDIIDRMRAIKPVLEAVDVPHRGHTPLLDEPVARGAIDSFLARVHET